MEGKNNITSIFQTDIFRRFSPSTFAILISFPCWIEDFQKIRCQITGHPTTHEGFAWNQIASGSLVRDFCCLVLLIGGGKQFRRGRFVGIHTSRRRELRGQVGQLGMLQQKKVYNIISTIDLTDKNWRSTENVLSLGTLMQNWTLLVSVLEEKTR